MKKILWIASVIFITVQLSGQSVKFGVHADPAVSWLNPETRNVVGNGAQFGISGGLVIENYFMKNYALVTGVSIGTESGKVKFGFPTYFDSFGQTDTLPAGTTVDYNLNYITVPLGLKLKTNQIGYLSYYARVGFTNQINVKSTASDDNDILSKDNIKDEIFFFNMSYHFGIGIEYNISQDTAIDFGVIYHNGFIDAARDKNFKLTTRALAIRAGVMF